MIVVEIYHSKIGDFWIEADGEVIPFKLITKSKYVFSPNSKVLDRKVFKPSIEPKKRINELRLMTNIKLSSFMYNDIISDEFVYGYDVIDESFNITFGTAVFTTDWHSKIGGNAGVFWEDGGDLKKQILPHYAEVDDISECRFSFAYKEFEDFDDLAINFACDFGPPDFEEREELISDIAYDIVSNLSSYDRNKLIGNFKGDAFLAHHNFGAWIRGNYHLHRNYGHPDDVSLAIVNLVFDLIREETSKY